ncbi:MAG TPA: class I SAM-dependent methyltransferase [Acidobacteriaceae bacterium]|nr:class I SAM-dependent methyltransferase [Acidobacteriaceae bacterium]
MRIRISIRVAIVLFFTALACTAQTGLCQSETRTENEQRIASLPQDQQAFERFRFWMSGLSQEELPPAGLSAEARQDALLSGFAAWLGSGGFTPGEVDKQVAFVRRRGSSDVAEFWNKYLVTERRDWVNSQPNGFLVEMIKGRKPGKALDVSMGEGRNTIWLAQQGWDTTGFDPADQAVAAARKRAEELGVKIHTEVTTDEQFDWGENKWDLIVLSYAGCSQLAPQVEKALKPAGSSRAVRGRVMGIDGWTDGNAAMRYEFGYSAMTNEFTSIRRSQSKLWL